MDIGVSFKELDNIDVTPLREAILSLTEEAWLDQQYRQQAYDVHRYTESVVLIFTDGEGWPNIEVRKESGWDLLAETAIPLMHEIIEKHYQPGGTIIRAMAAKLLSGGMIKPHTDKHPSFHYGHRIHIPITTNPRVRFMIDGRPHELGVGKVYEINNQQKHSVTNKGKDDRITFIFDYVPPERVAR